MIYQTEILLEKKTYNLTHKSYFDSLKATHNAPTQKSELENIFILYLQCYVNLRESRAMYQ